MGGNDKANGPTTDGQQEATVVPSQVNLGNGDSLTNSGVWRFSLDEDGRMATFCKKCESRVRTIRELMDHSCQV